jgi:hypothetical protein
LREAARDVLIEPVYNREKHPFVTPPAKVATAVASRPIFSARESDGALCERGEGENLSAPLRGESLPKSVPLDRAFMA